ncbi:MAG: hypothetical protein MJA82_15010 [Clostridia bacterium]|nr:hypothetical protein [Clostridia bacterium]
MVKKYKFIGAIEKTKYYVTTDGWLSKAKGRKFIELGYIDDNWSIWQRLCNGV